MEGDCGKRGRTCAILRTLITVTFDRTEVTVIRMERVHLLIHIDSGLYSKKMTHFFGFYNKVRVVLKYYLFGSVFRKHMDPASTGSLRMKEFYV